MSELNEIKCNINLRKDIKSKFNFEEIFSFIEQRHKLNIIIYNKELQKIFGVNIQDYKEISGRYKIGGKNGKGSEYTLDKKNLIFEGEYKKGRRNGNGKEYYQDEKLKFEGEYSNGEKWNGKGFNKNGIIDFQIENGNGKGKEYYKNGKLKFEGKYKNGKRNGKGKEYYQDEKLKFEGEYKNGKRNGKGKEYYKDEKLNFEGEYLYDRRNGKGKEYYYSGELKFEGEYFYGERWNGKSYNKNGKIDFQIKDGNGKGKE